MNNPNHNHLLYTVSQIGQNLISAVPENFDQIILESMQSLSLAIDVDRMYIWENYFTDYKIYAKQIYQWYRNLGDDAINPDCYRQFSIPDLDYDNVPGWKEYCLKSIIINSPVKYLDMHEQASLKEQGILAILIIPIHINSQFWGFVGFANCHCEQVFSPEQVEILQSNTNAMVASIIHNQVMRDLIKTKQVLVNRDQLLNAVNSIAILLLSKNDHDFEASINLSLELAAKAVDVDRSYLWKNTIVDDIICCTKLAEWANTDIFDAPNPATFPQNLAYQSIYPDWEQFYDTTRTLNNETVDMDKVFASFPVMKKVKAMMVVPIYIENRFWGFVGFDETKYLRNFTKEEKDILTVGGTLIASAIDRQITARDLLEAKEKAILSAQAKSDFLSRMSHEIRTPMNAIIGMTNLARKNSDLDKIQGYLGKVNSSSQQLLSLINDILDMSKIDANKLEIVESEFDFDRMMEHVFNVIQVKMDEKQLEFNYIFDHLFERNMISDELRISQVLTNLLSNAVKFTPNYGTISLIVKEQVINESKSQLHIEVNDTGVGISPDRQKNLFQSFEQADGSITRQYGGTGLGLAICKKIIELMDGKIWIESEEGKGAKFIFEIEVNWGSKRDIIAKNAVLSSDVNILIVDDSEIACENFSHILSDAGLNHDIVNSGEEALELVKANLAQGKSYDICFIDYSMPGLNGAETASAMQKLTGSAAQVIMISSYNWDEIRNEAAEHGVNKFLAKPIMPSTFFDTVVQMVGSGIVKDMPDDDLEPDNWQHKFVLLAEDIEINREIVLSILEDSKLNIDIATNGKEAYEIFKQNMDKYDLILMDIQMPIMDGISATKSIRALSEPKAQQIPIIAMTANAFKEDEQACIAAGMNGHIAKPIEIDKLFNTLDMYLN